MVERRQTNRHEPKHGTKATFKSSDSNTDVSKDTLDVVELSAINCLLRGNVASLRPGQSGILTLQYASNRDVIDNATIARTTTSMIALVFPHTTATHKYTVTPLRPKQDHSPQSRDHTNHGPAENADVANTTRQPTAPSPSQSHVVDSHASTTSAAEQEHTETRTARIPPHVYRTLNSNVGILAKQIIVAQTAGFVLCCL